VTQVRSYGRAGLLDLDLGQRAVEAVDDERHLVSELELLKLGHAIVADTNTGRLRTTKERKAKKKNHFFPIIIKKTVAGQNALRVCGARRGHRQQPPSHDVVALPHAESNAPFF
jgi:hypothetical protein